MSRPSSRFKKLLTRADRVNEQKQARKIAQAAGMERFAQRVKAAHDFAQRLFELSSEPMGAPVSHTHGSTTAAVGSDEG